MSKKRTIRYREGARFKTPAETAYAEIQRIAEASDEGVASPGDIVEAARPSHAPLHDEFEWHDPRAAEDWRKHQARKLANSIVITVEDVERNTTERAPAFVSVQVTSGDGDETRGYQATEVAFSSVSTFSRVELECERALWGWRQRYGSLKQFANVFAAIDAHFKERD